MMVNQLKRAIEASPAIENDFLKIHINLNEIRQLQSKLWRKTT